MRPYSLKKYFFSGFLLVAFALNAQIELKNKVVDFSTLLPLESASVYIQNTTVGTVTNQDGRFVLQVSKEF